MQLIFARHDRWPLQPLISFSEALGRIGAEGVTLIWTEEGPVPSGRGVTLPEDTLEALDAVNAMRARYEYVTAKLLNDLKRGDVSSYVDDPQAGLLRVPSVAWTIADWDGLLVERNVDLGQAVVGSKLEGRPVLFSRAEVDDWAVDLPAPAAIAGRTGDPGRPEKGATLYLGKFAERVSLGVALPTLNDEARWLLEWFKRERPFQQPPSAQTIKNRIREGHRAYRSEATK